MLELTIAEQQKITQKIAPIVGLWADTAAKNSAVSAPLSELSGSKRRDRWSTQARPVAQFLKTRRSQDTFLFGGRMAKGIV